jgi:hypothetical protein
MMLRQGFLVGLAVLLLSCRAEAPAPEVERVVADQVDVLASASRRQLLHAVHRAEPTDVQIASWLVEHPDVGPDLGAARRRAIARRVLRYRVVAEGLQAGRQGQSTISAKEPSTGPRPTTTPSEGEKR